MDKIDLGDILDKHEHFQDGISYLHRSKARQCMIEAIHQALVLASGKAEVKSERIYERILSRGEEIWSVNKQSILNIEKLII